MLPPVVPKRLTPFWLCESLQPCGQLPTLRVNVRSPSQPTWRPVRCEAPGGIRKNILRASHPPAAFCSALALATCSHLRCFHYSPDYMEAGGICQGVLSAGNRHNFILVRLPRTHPVPSSPIPSPPRLTPAVPRGRRPPRRMPPYGCRYAP